MDFRRAIPGALIYQSDVQVPPSTSDIGSFDERSNQKNRGSIGDRSKIIRSFSGSVLKRGSFGPSNQRFMEFKTSN